MSNTRNTLPFIGSIPIIGQLFTGRNKEKNKREILLSITPHIVRNLDVPRPDVATIWSGSEEDLAPGARFASFAGNDQSGNEADHYQMANMVQSSGQPAMMNAHPLQFRIAGPQVVTADQLFSIQITAQGVQDLVKARLALNYPNTLVDFVGVRTGSLLGPEAEDSLVEISPSKSLNTVVAEVRRSVGRTGVSGDGTIAVFEFKAKSGGPLEFSLLDCSLESGHGDTGSCEASSLMIEME